MDIIVKKLYDVSQIDVPEEMTRWTVSEAEAAEQLRLVARLAAQETDAAQAETGDCVVCTCLEGALTDRSVLLYPGLNMPGAETAEAAVLGMGVGSELDVVLNSAVHLRVDRIIRRMPAEINDALIQAQGIEGVETIADYCAWYRETAGAENRERVLKGITNYYLDILAEQSEFEYDEAAMAQRVESMIQEIMAFESAASGVSEDIPEEQMEAMRMQCRNMILRDSVAEALCRNRGIVFTPDMFDDEIKAMAEEMPGMEEMLEEYRLMYIQNAYMDRALELLNPQAEKCLEVA